MNSTCTVSYSNDHFEWNGYIIGFNATATSIHEDMVMYYKDGSGYPGYDGIEDYEWTINSITDENGNEVSLTEEQMTELDDAICDYLDDVDWEYPEDPYDDYEPDED